MAAMARVWLPSERPCGVAVGVALSTAISPAPRQESQDEGNDEHEPPDVLRDHATLVKGTALTTPKASRSTCVAAHMTLPVFAGRTLSVKPSRPRARLSLFTAA